MSNIQMNVPINNVYISDLCNGSISLNASIEEMNIKFPDVNDNVKHVNCSISLDSRDGFEDFTIEGDELYYVDI